MKTLFTTLTLIFFWLQSLGQCPAPISILTTSIGPTFATLSWNAVPSATKYWVIIKLANDTLWTTPISSNNNLDTFINLPHPYIFYPNFSPFNLTSSTNYDFAVCAECNVGGFSNWTQTQFTTHVPCDPPTVIAGTNSSTTATIECYSGNDPITAYYKVEYKELGSSVWNTIIDSFHFFYLNSLLPATNYEVRAQTFSIDGDSSAYTYTQFSTSCLPPDDIFITPTNSGMLNNPNGMHVWWNAQPNANSYTTDYFNNAGIFPGGGTSASTFINVCCLPPLVTYDIKVRSNCASGYHSAYKYTNYSTPLWSPTLSNPIIASTTAAFNWANISAWFLTINYTAEYQLVGNVNWTPIAATTSPNSRNLSGLIPGADYIFRVRTNATNYSNTNYASLWTIDTFTTQCPAPTGLNIPPMLIQPTSVHVDWNDMPVANYYRILVKANSPAGLPWDTIIVFPTLYYYPSSYYAFGYNSFSPSTSYQIKVQTGCVADVWSDFAYTTFTTLPICNKPNSLPPTNITNTTLTFNWNAVSGALSYVSNFKRNIHTWSSANFIQNTLTNRALSSLLPGTKYNFIVKVNCSANNASGYDTTSKTTLCPQPSSASVPNSTITATSAIVKWAAVAGVLSYQVEYKKNDAGIIWTPHASAITDTTTVISNLLHATNYLVRIKTNCNDTSSTNYTQASFTTKCPTPTIVSTITSSSQATITWTPIANILNYKIEYKESGGGSFGWSGYNSVTTSNPYIVLTNLDNNTNYEARVFTNCNSSLTSNYDTALFYTNCNNIPTGFFVSAKTNVQATINWTAAYGAAGYELRYRIVGSGGGGWQSPITTAATSYTLSGLSSNTSYEYKVRTICSGSGSGSGESSYSSNQPFTTLGACPMPSGLSAIPMATQAKLIWNSIPGVQSYKVEYKNSVMSWTPITYSTTDTFVNTPNTLTPSMNYEFQVRANCSGSSSSNYAQTTFITAPLCNVPTNVNVPPNSIGINKATVTWNNNTNALSYILQYKQNGQNWSPPVTVTTNSYTLSGLLSCTNYSVHVKTKCLSGDSSAYSNDYPFKTKTQGSDSATAIFIGQPPCVSNAAWTDTKFNSEANCFSNTTLPIPGNQNSKDIWYKFTLVSPATVQISHCGSTFSNTYLHLLDSAATQIDSNDTNGPLCVGNRASISKALPAGIYYIVSEANGSSAGSITTSIKTLNSCFSATGMSVLNLKFFIQGYYNANEEMLPVLMNQGIANANASDVDDILVELRDANDPTIIVESDSTMLATDGSASCSFSSLSGNYYIVVKHRNTIETWSKNPVSIGLGTTQYNFHTAATQAFGDNQIEVESGVWALYTGDIVQDENMDLADLSSVELDMNSFMYGYLSTDANGDGNVDLIDYQIVEGNISNFIFANHP